MGNAFYSKNNLGDIIRIRNMSHKNVAFGRTRAIFLNSKGIIFNVDGSTFTNSPPSTIWEDISGQGHDLIAYGFSYTATSGSNGEGWVAFDGVNDYLCLSDVNDFNFQASFVLNTTFKLSSFTNRKTICGNFETAGFGISIGWYDDAPNYQRICGIAHLNGAYKCVPANDLVQVGVEYAVSLVYDGSFLSMYINDVKQTTEIAGSGIVKQSAMPFSVGANSNVGGATEFLHGLIKSVSISNTDTQYVKRRLNL